MTPATARLHRAMSASCSLFFDVVEQVRDGQALQHLDPRVFELSSTYELEPAYEGLRTRRMSLRIAPTTPQHTWIRKLELEVHLEPGQPVQIGISRKYEPAQIATLAGSASNGTSVVPTNV